MPLPDAHYMIPSAEAGPEPHKTGHRMLDLAVAGSALLVAPSDLRPGPQVYSLTWARTEANARYWDEFDRVRLAGRIDLPACYCSMFDDCREASMTVFRPRPVPHC